MGCRNGGHKPSETRAKLRAKLKKWDNKRQTYSKMAII